MTEHELIIIGSGPAGYTAAIYAARADLKPLLFAGTEPGGQLMLTSDVENWPGEPTGILGPDLMEKLKAQAERFGTEIVQEEVIDIDTSARPFVIKTDKREVKAKAVIVATGAVAKWLGIPGEKELQGKGVSACATCDGFFFRDKKVVVVGGGDAAMEEAIFITKFASEVTVLLRRDVASMRASKIMKDRAIENPKISFREFTESKELVGTEKLEGVKVVNNQTQEEEILPADGFFVAIGHKPNTELFKGKIDLDDNGYIVREANTTKTSLEGLFACGDVIDPYYRQAITSAGTGCMAALDAERWMAHQK